jgi:hypothetical protein
MKVCKKVVPSEKEVQEYTRLFLRRGERIYKIRKIYGNGNS